MIPITNKKVACVRPWYSTFSNRQVSVCCWQKTYIGKLDKNSTLDSIWNSDQAVEIRRDMFNAPEREVPAKHCPKDCGGRLPSEKALKEYRDLAESGATHSPLPPHEMGFVVDHICNLRCKMCWIFEDLTFAQSPEGLRNILYEVHKKQFKHATCVNILGGEPFFSKNSRALVQTILDENLNLRLSFITNLTIFDEKLLERIKPNGIGSFTISFDGGTKKTYEAIRKNSDFEKVVGNIRKLCKYRYERSLNLGENHWEISVPSIIMTSNFEEIDQTFDLFKDLPVFLIFVPPNRGFRPGSQEQIFDFVPQQKRLLEKLKSTKERVLRRLDAIDEWEYTIPIHAKFNEEERHQKKKEYLTKTIESIDKCIDYLWDILCSKNPLAFSSPKFDVEVTQEGVAKFIEPRTDPEKNDTVS